MIPSKILDIFLTELEKVEFGKVTLAAVRRGKHIHFEIDKHYTLLAEEDEQLGSKKEVVMEN